MPVSLNVTNTLRSANPRFVPLACRAVVLFAQFFGASSDSLEHFFQLAPFLGRDILKGASDESSVLAEDGKEYSASFLGKRNGTHAAVAIALHATDQPLLVETINCDADRSGVEVHLRANHVDGQRPFVQKNFQHPEIRFAQPLFENRGESKVTDRP